jgi:molybdate transport system substrate-binding protein
MKSGRWSIVVLFSCSIVLLFSTALHAGEELMMFCGAAFKLPMEEITAAFVKKTGCTVYVSYGGVATVLAQAQLGRRGDLFVVPSPDAMERARSRGLIVPASLKDIGYVVPAINVRAGNSKGIRNLRDMTRPGIRVAIANPKVVFVGMLGAEIVDKALGAGEREQFRKNIVTYPEDPGKLATLLVLKQVDAIIGFSLPQRLASRQNRDHKTGLQSGLPYRGGTGGHALLL